MTDAQAIAAKMATYSLSPNTQNVQTEFRMRLAESWDIPKGARVLEIGCGQGDMTAVLAAAVGETGHVTAVDIAEPTYGAPVTLGESAASLKQSPLGSRIDFHFAYDVLDPSHAFGGDAFDYLVLAHCSWYFENLDQLRRTLRHIRPWAPRLCFSEWSIEPQTFDQTAHLLSILIQGQIEAHRTGSDANVRTPFSKIKFLELLSEAGWEAIGDAEVDSSGLQDGKWEYDIALHAYAVERDVQILPVKVLDLIGSQVDVLKSIRAQGENRSLPSYAIVAQRPA